jgi:hypothetical protein
VKNWDGVTKLSIKRGRYGASKVKAFNVLKDLPADQYLSVRQLCLWTGIDYFSIARALSNWTRWEYVARYPTTSIGEGDYSYRLLARGRSWLQLALSQLPNAPIFIEELSYWQREVIADKFARMRGLKFKNFVSELHALVQANRSSKTNT